VQGPVKLVRVLVLEGFILEPGRAGRPGEFVDIATHVANTAIACGKARLPTSDDYAAPHEPVSRDPKPINRDPIPTRRSRK
jgi:hypothetical protein